MAKMHKLFSASLLEQKFRKYLEDPKIKVISFDLFDTLFFRKCGKAVNVFEIMGEHPEIIDLFDNAATFSHYRQNAEKLARKENTHKEDITLDAIYKQFPLTSQEQKRFQELELQIEEEMLVLNRQLARWIEYANDAGKDVICISDMYLSCKQVQIVALSKLHSAEKIKKIYMSNECNATKATGSLFVYVMNERKIKPSELLHIGDNERSDIVIAQNFGIQTLYYAQDKAQKQRELHEMLYMQESVPQANHVRLHATLLCPYEDALQKFYFAVGASIFAPILWEFSHWLAHIQQKHKREKFAFIMREGALLQKCLQSLYPKIETELLYASRKSTHFLTLSAEDIGAINFAMYKNFTLQDLYQNLFLEISNTILLPYKKLLCQDLDTTFVGQATLLSLVLEDITQQKQKIQEALEHQHQLLARYLEELRIDANCSLVDFGGGGTIIKRLISFLPKHRKPKLNILFYQHAEGYTKLLQEHVLSFLPFTKKTAHAIESIHRTPEFVEILLNGIEATTQSYTQEGDASRPQSYIPSTNKHNITPITEAFHKGITLFFELAKTYELAPQSYSRESLTLLLARLIELPTQQESEFFGALEYDEGKASEHIYKLIDQQKLDHLQTQGLEKTHRDFLSNPVKYRAKIPWMEGTITQLSATYLKEFYKVSTNPNQEIIDSLLHKLDRSRCNKVMVYGAGELFVQLLPHLLERDIEIEALIDTRAEVQPFSVEGYKVVSLAQALQEKSEAIIVVASGVYAKNITSTIENYAQKNHKRIDSYTI
ncbi:MAG: HAD hydrolase-like protein [Helicobacteraceae bacterium]|nr:HAD hydrolase-like protein [Helicobacteraceae bacterium]